MLSLGQHLTCHDSTGAAQDPIPGYDADASKHIYNSLLSLLCNPGHLGDMYQATSTNDITFWVIHNTVDRLWHFKRLGNLANYDETWDPYNTCYGHNPRNVQPFTDLFGDAPSRRLTEAKQSPTLMKEAAAVDASAALPFNGYYTNMELYEHLHPNNRALQYVYDNFLWPHCSKLGMEMDNSI